MTPSEVRLESRDRLFLWTCLAVTLVSLALGIYLYPRVHPEASIRFETTREEAARLGAGFAASRGIALTDARHAGRFTFDETAKVFLERSLGAADANTLAAGPLHLWRWAHRWFRPLETEEFRVEYATTGELVAFEHRVAEEAPGERLDVEGARREAEEFLHITRGIAPGALVFLDVVTRERPARTDHTFVFRDPSLHLGEGDCRHEVTVVGGAVGAYRQFVHVPESWRRDYEGLRAKNESAGLLATFFLVLTVLAAVVVFLRRIRLRDVRWRLALGLGAVAAGLSFLGQLNLYPLYLYGFDTTASWSAFHLTGLLQLVQSALAVGLFVFVLAAAADPLYRERYPERIALAGFFTRRGLRTKRFLLQTVLGFTLTAGFFLYQDLFYLAAGRLGAWAPAQVPYDDLLGTALPVAFLLLVGFQPAVTEELLSRMFSIPFLEKVTGRASLAVLLPALVWGFAHAGYPNQPFFVRGLEVGLAGVVIGVVFLRTGILAPLVWHFLVDALYGSILLVRSGEPYYVGSALLASGLLLLPLTYATIAYLRSGRFEDPEPLRARAQPGAREPEWIPALETTPPPPPPTPWSGRRRAGALLGGSLVLAAALLVPSRSLESPAARTLSREEARDRADEVARRLLAPASPDSFRVAVIASGAGTPDWLRYAAEVGGREAAQGAVRRYSAACRWRVRYFQSLTATEVTVELDARDGALVGLSRRLAEAEARPSLDSRSAETRALGFLVARGVETSRLELRESRAERRPARLDHTFVWEARAGDEANIGEGRDRYEVVVQGDEVGGYQRTFRVPEAWQRDRDEAGFLDGARLVLLTLTLGLLGGIVGWFVFDGHRRGVTHWGRVVRLALPFGLLAALARLNQVPAAWFGYDTATPWSQFLLLSGALLGLSSALLFGAQVVAGAVLGTLFPDIWHFRRHAHRRAAAVPALLAALVGLGLWLLGTRAVSALGSLAPAAVPPVVGAAEVEGLAAWFEIVARVGTRWLLAAALLAALVRLLQFARVEPRVGALLLLAVLLVPEVSRGLEPWLAGLAALLLAAAGAGLYVAWVGRRNRLAYGLTLWVCLGASELLPYLGARGLYFQMQGAIALAVLALPLLWVALTATVGEGGETAETPRGLRGEQG